MRKNHSAAFKAKIVVEALRETKTLAQIASENQLHPTLLTKWKAEALEGLTTHFERSGAQEHKTQAQERKIAELYQEIGRLTTQVNWLKKNLVLNLSRSERMALVERNADADAEVPLVWQAGLLSLSRSSLYYQPRPAGKQEIKIKHRLDELYTDYPFLGSRKLVAILAREGIAAGRHMIRRYRQEMGLSTLYPAPKLSVPGGVEHKVYPVRAGTHVYLLRNLVIDRPNQVWGVDITYIRLRGGWMYPVVLARHWWHL